MVYEPQLPEVRRHIDHYWILDSADLLALNSTHMYAYPGITPDMIIMLEGHYSLSYMGQQISSNRSKLFSFIHGKVYIDFSKLRSCIIVKFKSRGLSSLQPFVGADSDTMMKNSVAYADDVFEQDLERFKNHLSQLEPSMRVRELDEWFAKRYRKEHEGFVIEMAEEVSKNCDLRTIMNATGYSYSTLERYFKKETGLTPKNFQTLQRFKKALRELHTTNNDNWTDYVTKYGYYDQSHFIKEMKRFTSCTPSELLKTPAFIKIRPDYR